MAAEPANGAAEANGITSVSLRCLFFFALILLLSSGVSVSSSLASVDSQARVLS